jgi:hypothetical protein
VVSREELVSYIRDQGGFCFVSVVLQRFDACRLYDAACRICLW